LAGQRFSRIGLFEDGGGAVIGSCQGGDLFWGEAVVRVEEPNQGAARRDHGCVGNRGAFGIDKAGQSHQSVTAFSSRQAVECGGVPLRQVVERRLNLAVVLWRGAECRGDGR
jgi:hypothetical protein